MQPKAVAIVLLKGSPYTNTPKSSVIEGEIYCKKPTSFKGSLRAHAVKSKSGVAVTTPAPASSQNVAASHD